MAVSEVSDGVCQLKMSRLKEMGAGTFPAGGVGLPFLRVTVLSDPGPQAPAQSCFTAATTAQGKIFR